VCIQEIQEKGTHMARNDEYATWLRNLAGRRLHGDRDRLGTANFIDAAARMRARESMRTGESVSLARPLVRDDHSRLSDANPRFAIEHHYDSSRGWATDHVDLDCHGFQQTHVDGLNHRAVDGSFYGGSSWGDDELTSVVQLAEHGLFTRAWIADIPAVRGTPWVSEDEPVVGADIEAALGDAVIQSGDALLLYMGRDRWEAAGHGIRSGVPWPEGKRRTGVGQDAAVWIANSHISMLAWDFHDALHEEEPEFCVHNLLWAIGLVIIDNCEFTRVVQALRVAGRADCALAVLPFALPGGTGCNVTPTVFL
jgi:hypothetical protein